MQVTETSNSNAMELEGLKRCFKHLHERGIVVSTLTTDRHKQINSYLKGAHPLVTHMFDPWHIAKGKKINYIFIEIKWQENEYCFGSIMSSNVTVGSV